MMEHVRDAVVEYLALLTPNPNRNPNRNRNPNPNPKPNPNQVEYLALLHTDAASLDLRFTGWANVNRRGDSNALHEHVDPDWALSGVAYLSAGGDPSHTSPYLPHLPISLHISPHLPTSPYTSLSPGGDPSCAPRFMRPWALGAAEHTAEHTAEHAGEEPPLFNVSAGRIAPDPNTNPTATAAPTLTPTPTPHPKADPNPNQVSAGRIVLFPAWLQHYVPPHCGEGA